MLVWFFLLVRLRIPNELFRFGYCIQISAWTRNIVTLLVQKLYLKSFFGKQDCFGFFIFTGIIVSPNSTYFKVSARIHQIRFINLQDSAMVNEAEAYYTRYMKVHISEFNSFSRKSFKRWSNCRNQLQSFPKCKLHASNETFPFKYL